ncbi:MAG: type II toxin-antitoxin system VapC family toxin, partial [Beutenbergiaceae bacterium]
PTLGPAARAHIVESSRVYFSSVSILEITIKAMLGRLDLPGGAEFPRTFANAGLVELRFSSAHAAALAAWPDLARHDRFDRMLLAQAKTESLRLLTSDSLLLGLGESWILNARH